MGPAALRTLTQERITLMKTSLCPLIGLATLVGALALSLPAAGSDPGLVDFGAFDPPDDGSQFVEIQIKGNLINMVSRLARASEPEAADLLSKLRLIRVNILGLTDANRDQIVDRMRQLRGRLEVSGWDRVVTAQDPSGADVAVYLKLRGDEAVEGVVVTVLDGGKQAVFVNIAGDLRPEQLATVGERFNIEPLKNIQPAS
jgi:hypothetical protein